MNISLVYIVIFQSILDISYRGYLLYKFSYPDNDFQLPGADSTLISSPEYNFIVYLLFGVGVIYAVISRKKMAGPLIVIWEILILFSSSIQHLSYLILQVLEGQITFWFIIVRLDKVYPIDNIIIMIFSLIMILIFSKKSPNEIFSK